LFFGRLVVLFRCFLVCFFCLPFSKFALFTAGSVPLTFLLSVVTRAPAPVRRIL